MNLNLSMFRSVAAMVGGFVLAISFSSCTGPGFSAAYRDSLTAYRTAEAKPPVAGPWEGYWKSDVNGHTGNLRAIGTPTPSAACASDGSDHYSFRYHATWAEVLSGGYTSDHQVKKGPDGSYLVQGEKDIALIGRYSSKGSVVGDLFETRYQSESDNGVFVLKRPE